MSGLGLADDERDAAARTRERAARRAAHLALSWRAPWRSARLARALRAAGVAHDPVVRERMLAELAVLRCADELATLPVDSPWSSTSTVPTTASTTTNAEPPSGSPVDTTVDTAADRPARVHAGNGSGRGHEPAGWPTLDPPASADTIAGGVLDGVILAAHADDTATPWSTLTKNAAVDQADTLLPHRTPRALTTALHQIGVSVAESTVRRRRAQRPRPTERTLAPAGKASAPSRSG